MKLTKQELLGLRDMISKTSMKTIEKYKQLNEANLNGEVLILGDSMVEYLNPEMYLPGFNIINRGVAGATTESLLNSFEDITKNINASKIFISIGSNDLVLLESTSEEAVKDIEKVLFKIKSKFPNAQVFYLSTTPVLKEGHKLYKKIYVAGRTNEENLEINKGVLDIVSKFDVKFINQYDSLVDHDGYLIESYTPDGIHLNKEGYKIYAINIKKYL
ncbi:hypothetical protein JV173_00500 [Acholeplasma equirhinis]|uniref:SGNH/GDSL hydrolase family protein n=1 Tax=Acholeplasma equirhinis TaxID=555393 RepID=UPI00197B05F1|nr:GDSL-type esterase/lipase family protein [Acholeplasma equirhinis]MBN3489983.1 hypothetical protein [Acholeplasma equirhinis]